MDPFYTDDYNYNYCNNNNYNRGGENYNYYCNPTGGESQFCFEDRPRKRPFFHHPPPPSDSIGDGLGFVKLYVAGIPITITQEEIHSLFEAHGNIVEIALLTDKKTGLRKECCFVKYATKEAGDRAIAALNNRYIFPGAKVKLPIKVRYAEGERVRLGNTGNHVLKLYVNGLHKQASKVDIAEIFSAYGHIEDIHIVRDEFKQSRGFGFIQFARRDMAIAAINALNGTFVMAGCDQPLHVRFSEPKKPKFGDPRNNSKVGDTVVGSHFQEQFARPVPYLNDSMAGNVRSNVNRPISPKTKASSSQCVEGVVFGTSVAEVQNELQRLKFQCGPLDLNPTAEMYWAKKMCYASRPLDLNPTVHIETSAAKSPRIRGKSDNGCSSPVAPDSEDCDWSEHTCPDGYKYYYNCVSCESRWEKPHEYSLFERQLQNQHEYQQRSGSCNHSQSPSTTPQEVDHRQVPVMPRSLVETCG